MVARPVKPERAGNSPGSAPLQPPYWRAGFLLFLCSAALLWPVLEAAIKCRCLLACQDAHCDVDSFPLSTFPMFSSNRRQVTLAALRGITAAGKRVAIPPALLGTSEVMQARVTVQTAANAGRRESRALCQRVAKELASRRNRLSLGELAFIVKLELTLDNYDTIAYFTEARSPRSSKVVARCDAAVDERDPESDAK